MLSENQLFGRTLATVFVSLLGTVSGLFAQTASAASISLSPSQTPLTAASSVPPMVMIDLSKDHSLFYKAYNDYTALDSSTSTIQTTYDDTITYYGIFDSGLCYTYQNTVVPDAFQPAAASSGANSHYCKADNGQWSGNFLNWAAMGRIDAVRKLLYGGTRTVDTVSRTVLSRHIGTSDAHAWAKFYNGSDIGKLTPFSPTPTTAFTATGSFKLDPAVSTSFYAANRDTPTYQFNVTGAVSQGAKYVASVDLSFGDVVKLASHSHPEAYVVGFVNQMTNNGTFPATVKVGINVSSNNIPATFTSAVTDSQWDVTVLNESAGGITMCSLSRTATASQPLLRVAKGNYSLWAANENWQCMWHEEVAARRQIGSSNGNVPLASSLNAATDYPIEAVRGLTGTYPTDSVGEYYVNVVACDNSTAALQTSTGAPIGTARCKQYPSGNYKPIGLLQVYGDTNLMQFGLMTGSYSKNISGGVLRREMSNFSTEVNVATNGTFTGIKGIVSNIDALRMVGYGGYNQLNVYDYKNSAQTVDNCGYQLAGLVHSGGSGLGGYYANEGACVEWGNPMSEVYLESLRYLAGKQPNPDFLYDESASASPPNFDYQKLGMSQKKTWVDPLNNSNYCASLNAIVINSAYTSYDRDQMGGMSDLGTTKTANYWTNLVGDGEGITGNSFFIGNNGSGGNSCTPKIVSGLGNIYGICPESPTHEGSYLIAGAAYYAHTNRIRSDLTVPDADTKSLKVTTYGVQLASASPNITISVNGKSVVIQPSYIVYPYYGGGPGNGTLVDFKVLTQTATSGSFYVNWEDSAQGGDYDQDTWGIISYQVVGNKVLVTTNAISCTSNGGQGFGYVISGTTNDGTHYHSGALNFTYTDPNPIIVSPTTNVNASGGCQNCTTDMGATTVTYTVSSGSGGVLQDPLYYASKWGGFNTANATGTQPKPAAGDGTDNYFYVTNPAQLETSLSSALSNIAAKSSATAITANSSTLQTTSAIYEAIYNSTNWTGQLLSYKLAADGTIGTVANWDASVVLSGQTPNSRVILTYNNNPLDLISFGGIPFRYASLPTNYRSAMGYNSVGVADARASDRVSFIRGDRSNEGTTSSYFRTRGSVLGDIVDSSPNYVGAPSSGYSGTDYKSFAVQYQNRTPVVYTGANDGMMHGFNANTGAEMFAFVPSTTMSAGAPVAPLATLTYQTYAHRFFADGTPVVEDAYLDNNGGWKTLLVAGMNFGGKEVYALDVTNPDAVTEARANSVVQWEFTNAQDADLGYTYGRPAIVKLANGKWAAVFGNGYNSTAGKAYLYIVYLDRPAGSRSWIQGVDYLKIRADTTNTGTGSNSNNGLSEILPVDISASGTTTLIYAGDLNGNLWKFDLSSTNPTQWGLASTRPLFATPGSQPITSSPDIIRNTKQGGYVLVFGTGMFLQTSDPADRTLQAMYGIWDNPAVLTSSANFTVPFTSLQQQTITNEIAVAAGTARVTSSNATDYASKRGWYMNLISPPAQLLGERIVYNPTIYAGRVVFTTLIPSQIPCDNGGSGYLMELDALSGSSTTTSTLDTNNDGKISATDVVTTSGTTTAVASGLKTQGIPAGFTRIAGGTDPNKIYTGGLPGSTITESSSGVTGRLSWREVMN